MKKSRFSEEQITFAAWKTATSYDQSNYKPLPWWQAYNRLKHNRLMNRKEAQLQCAVQAVAALLLAITKCHVCWDALLHTGWVSSVERDPVHCLLTDTHVDGGHDNSKHDTTEVAPTAQRWLCRYAVLRLPHGME